MDLIAQGIAWLSDPANWSGPDGIPTRLLEHIYISGLALVVAAAVTLPLGLWIGHTRRFTAVVANSANAWRALPSFALIGLLVPFTTAFDPNLGFTFYPTLIAMIVLAGPPILVNAYEGIAGVDADLVDAARGVGMRERQILRSVELPIALPVIVTGLRSAAVQVVATATLGANFAFGGLGRYLVIGHDTQDYGEVFAAVFLVAALALTVQGVFLLLERALVSPGVRRSAARTA